MKSRGIAVGASVIALALGAAGPSAAAGLGDIAPKVNAEAGAGLDANAQLGGVKTQANLDAYQWSNSHNAGIAQGTDAAGGVKVNGDRAGVPSIVRSGKVPARAGVRAEVRLKSGHTFVKGGARLSTQANLRVAKHARVKAHAKTHASHVVRSKRTRSIGGERLVPKTKGGHSLPFRDIGREVGNPMQPLLAGWLLMLTAGICMGAARMVRRRGHRLN
jgi:hypothetical protein